MVGKDLKAETMALMDKRTAIEAEMNATINRLCQPGGPGLSGNLVDSEGFPRSDIDIPTVRAARLRLSELKNDHKDITDRIDQNIQRLHESKLASKSMTLTDAEPANRRETSADAGAISGIPFAMIDELAEASPAAEDGLQLGDQIVRFGNVESGDNLVSKLASEVQRNEGRAIPVVVIRQGAAMTLSVMPRTWSGRGQLGCHFRML